jgi:CspA family cold shock protein
MALQGTIKKIVRDKGFGFIRADDGMEFFFHRSAVSLDVDFETLREGERVAFEEQEGGTKGPRAQRVERA